MRLREKVPLILWLKDKVSLMSKGNYPIMSPKKKHQEETPEHRKTRLAAQRKRARLGMSNLRQRRHVEEPSEQRETGLAADRDSTKRRRVEKSPEQHETRLAASRQRRRVLDRHLRTK